MPRTTRLTALAVALACTSAAANDHDGAIVVTASRFATQDKEATFASEIHTRKQIEQSGATSLFDYLARQSSLQVMPSFGNRHTPLFDLRGYGIENGAQNVVVSVDGFRLNSIDIGTPMLGGIALADIERIEITKGSGSVIDGDGAMAGTIHLHTRRGAASSASGYAGNHGAIGGAATATLRGDSGSLAATATRDRFDGSSREDAGGHRDASASDTWRLRAELAPNNAVSLRAGAGEAEIDARYVNPLTLAEFDTDPTQNGGAPYTHQALSSESWHAGGDLWFSETVRLGFDHRHEDKRSEFLAPFTFAADYEHRSSDLGLYFDDGTTTAVLGAQTFDGARAGGFDTTSKDSTAAFMQAQHRIGRLRVSAGGRNEKIEYAHRPTAGAASATSLRLRAWDLGANYAFDAATSAFVNYNSAFQAPDIDRFFRFDPFSFNQIFNEFIQPARSRTATVGVHHTTPRHRLQLAAFRSELRNEIYFADTGIPFDPASVNTNLDESHKYGVELQHFWQASDALGVSLNYAWTRALIDREEHNGIVLSGKELPGVPRHSATLGAAWRLNRGATVAATHRWRSSSFAFNDLGNDNAQRQAAYSSTSLSYRNQLKDNLAVFAAVDNVFARQNGLWVNDDAIYPVDFARNWRAGLEARF